MRLISFRRSTILFSLLLLISALLPACAQTEPALESEEDKTLYALGLAFSRNLEQVDLTEAELETVMRGLRDGVLERDPQCSLEEYGPKIQVLVQARVEAKTEEVRAEGVAFLEKMAEADGAQKTESGMLTFDEVVGEGPSPTASDQVKVHYRGTFPDGKEFDSSIGGEPAVFSLNRVVPCFTEGIVGMKTGGKRKLVCPSDLAYGERGSAPLILPGATLVFEIELIEIVAATEQ